MTKLRALACLDFPGTDAKHTHFFSKCPVREFGAPARHPTAPPVRQGRSVSLPALRPRSGLLGGGLERRLVRVFGLAGVEFVKESAVGFCKISDALPGPFEA